MMAQSIPVTIIAVAWNIFAIFMVMFPANTDPTADTMNYTVAVGGGWIGLCVIYFYLPKYGAARFTGGGSLSVACVGNGIICLLRAQRK